MFFFFFSLNIDLKVAIYYMATIYYNGGSCFLEEKKQPGFNERWQLVSPGSHTYSSFALLVTSLESKLNIILYCSLSFTSPIVTRIYAIDYVGSPDLKLGFDPECASQIVVFLFYFSVYHYFLFHSFSKM